MSDENLLNGFIDGFAKEAESAGLQGEAVQDLFKLAVCLGYHVTNNEAFEASYKATIEG